MKSNTMKGMLVALNILLALAGLQASPAPQEAVPIYQQPFGSGDVSIDIVNGEEAGVGQFPHQASIRIDGIAFCGGSLISKDWVMSAGHCVTFGKQTFVITLGSHKIKESNEPGRVTLTTKNGFVPDNYSIKPIANDIGLIKLPKSVDLGDRINIIPLPPRSFSSKDFVGTTVRVSGWGKMTDSATSVAPTLQYVDVTVISNDECRSVYGNVVTSKFFCCSGKEKKGTCSGDSGGSIAVGTGKDAVNLGVVSFGAAVGCTRGYPTGYTRTVEYLDWISQKTGIKIRD